ncbi:hypothetical protein ACY3OZ_002058 [Salmonella enterica]
MRFTPAQPLASRHQHYLIKQRRFLLATDTASTLIDALSETLKDPGATALWDKCWMKSRRGKWGWRRFWRNKSKTSRT